MHLKICHLYPDILNLYGDRGNILCMLKRLAWRGITADVTGVSVGDPLHAEEFDLFFIGGGQDPEEGRLLPDLLEEKGSQIRAAVEAGKTFLAISTGYQLLGKFYQTPEGEQIPLLGVLDLHTVAAKERQIGNFLFSWDETGQPETVVGFENHAGQTFLGSSVRPLGRVLTGSGNNGQDKTEGARYKNVFASYSHGPLLPKNPKLCDFILERALSGKHGDVALADLDDSLEGLAHNTMKIRVQT